MQTDAENLVPRAHIYPSGCVFKNPQEIEGKKITVMGLGLNGGGEASVRYLLSKGAFVTVTDMKSEAELSPTLERIFADSTLDFSRLTLHLGGHKIEDFSEADCVIKNPGVKFDGNVYLSKARAIETDISLFLAFTNSPIIAVTGSKGKSSTVSAIHFGLCEAGFTAFLGGNITVSPLTFLEKTNKNTPVVLELSSWQLADLRGRNLLKPKVSVITKIVPDHQNFYHSMIAYVADKKIIFQDQTKSDFSIFDFDDDEAADGGTLIKNWGDIFARESKAKVLRYSKIPLPNGTEGAFFKNGDGIVRFNGREDKVLGELLTPGTHIRTNALNAALVLKIFGVDSSRILEILGKWKGIEHRLEFFHEWQNSKFYNDSAATVPESAAAAAKSFARPVVLICGGTDKGLDLSPLSNSLANSGKLFPAAIFMLSGTATDKLQKLFESQKIKIDGVFDSLFDLLCALKKSFENAKIARGTPVVFSPGATSFGMFKNEFDRGNTFKKNVREIFVD